ncbi:hypothetical protein ACC676_36160 [Rhizobium ruizarguesonis]
MGLNVGYFGSGYLARAATRTGAIVSAWRHVERRRPASSKKFITLLAQPLAHFEKFVTQPSDSARTGLHAARCLTACFHFIKGPQRYPDDLLDEIGADEKRNGGFFYHCELDST